MPKLQEQTDLYRKAIDVAGDNPVTFRTLDLGGDKILPYIDPVPEEKSIARTYCGGRQAAFTRHVSYGVNRG